MGGLALVVALLESLARPQGITDIYQLRMQACMALQRLVAGEEGWWVRGGQEERR